jgi:signal transduction histidine kinase
MKLRRLAADAGIVAVLAVATAAYVRRSDGWAYFAPDPREVVKIGPGVWHTELTRWWVATGVGMSAMLLRSRFPLVAVAGATAMTAIHLTLSFFPLLPLDAAAPIALFTIAAGPGPRWLSYCALGAMLGLSAVPAVRAYLEHTTALIGDALGGNGLALPAAVALSWLLGDRGRARQELAARQARDLERERDQQAEIGAAAERARIARELHDAVAHGLAIIVIQAQAGAGALDRRPAATRTAHDATARTALDAIEVTGRDSLTEMRRLLGLDRPGEADLAPLPGTADLPALAARVSAAGLPVDLDLAGDLSVLPTGVGLSAYRIVQEALTNALKYAGPQATVHVEVCQGQDAIELTVADTGRGAGGPPDELRGNGLRGMRERVALLGGTLTVGDNPGGGFQVHAHLPLAVST